MFPLAAQEGAGPSGAAVVLAIAAALILAVVGAEVVAAVLRGLGRRRWLPAHLSRRARMPVRALLAALAVWGSVGVLEGEPSRGFVVTMAATSVAATTWLLAVVLPACTDAVLQRHRTDIPGRRHARGSAALARTLRRVVRWLVIGLGAAGALVVVEATRPAGVVVLALWLLAVAVLAVGAGSSLRDVAAGLQLALTDAVRLDDVIVVDGEWGRVEEITATSVLVQAWDDRRIVVPSRRLTGTSFENWTRRSADLVGGVELDLDPATPVTRVRAELVRVLEGNDLWDRRVAVLQVVGATRGWVRVRATVSAADAPRLHDLQHDVLEALVEWLRLQAPGRGPEIPVRARHGEVGGVPISSAISSAITSALGATGGAGRQVESVASSASTPAGGVPATTARLDPRRDARLFTGSVFAVERSRVFMGPGEDVLAERDDAGEDPR